MKKVFYLITVFSFITSSFLISRSSALAAPADCASFGYMQVSPSSQNRSLNEDSVFDLTFSWSATTPPPVSCFSESLVLRTFVNGSVISSGDKTIGAVGRGETKRINHVVRFSDFIASGNTTAINNSLIFRLLINPFLSSVVTVAETSAGVQYQTQNTTFACISADDFYKCPPDGTPQNVLLQTCQGIGPCLSRNNPKRDCQPLDDKNKCGQKANFTSTPPPGATPPPGSTPPPSSGGTTQTFNFSIPNPLVVDSLGQFVIAIRDWMIMLAIPIAVIMIVYAGLVMLFSRGEPAKIIQARKILTYALVGLAIILIGSGFVSLIESILSIGGSPTGTTPTPTVSVAITPVSGTGTGQVGASCQIIGGTSNSCASGLVCTNYVAGPRCETQSSGVGIACDVDAQCGPRFCDASKPVQFDPDGSGPLPVQQFSSCQTR